MYRYKYRKVGSEVWEGLLDSKPRQELSGQDMLQEYEFRVSYIGRDAIPNFRDVTTAIVV